MADTQLLVLRDRISDRGHYHRRHNGSTAAIATAEPTLREHAIFVLSQRGDEAAFNEPMRIARDDSDKHMRARALFWLGQKDDPRVAKLIGDRLSR